MQRHMMWAALALFSLGASCRSTDSAGLGNDGGGLDSGHVAANGSDIVVTGAENLTFTELGSCGVWFTTDYVIDFSRNADTSSKYILLQIIIRNSSGAPGIYTSSSFDDSTYLTDGNLHSYINSGTGTHMNLTINSDGKSGTLDGVFLYYGGTTTVNVSGPWTCEN